MTIQFPSNPVLVSYRGPDHNNAHQMTPQESDDDHNLDFMFEFDYPLGGDHDEEESTVTSFFSHDDDDSTILSDFDVEELDAAWINDIDFPSKSPQRRHRAGRRPTKERLAEMREALERDIERLTRLRAERSFRSTREEELQATLLGQLRPRNMSSSTTIRRRGRVVERTESTSEEGDSLRMNRRRLPRTTAHTNNTSAEQAVPTDRLQCLGGDFVVEFVVDLNDTCR